MRRQCLSEAVAVLHGGCVSLAAGLSPTKSAISLTRVQQPAVVVQQYGGEVSMYSGAAGQNYSHSATTSQNCAPSAVSSTNVGAQPSSGSCCAHAGSAASDSALPIAAWAAKAVGLCASTAQDSRRRRALSVPVSAVWRVASASAVEGQTPNGVLLAGSWSARTLHGMVSVMTAAESARDLLSAISHPVSYSELASHLVRDYSVELFDSLSGLVLCHLEELNGPELSNLLWAYGTVGHRNLSVATCVMASLSGKLSELGPAELANALWALQRLGLYDPQFVSAASEHVWDGLPAATPRQLAAIVQSYAWLRQQDPYLEEDEDLLRSIAAKFRAQLPTACATDVALVLSGMARLRRADEALLDDACGVLRGVADDAGLPALAEAIWSCALLQHRDLVLLELVAERVAEVLRHATGLVPAQAASSHAAGPPGGCASARLAPLRPTAESAGVGSAAAAAAGVLQSAASGVGVPRRHDLPSIPPRQQQQQQQQHDDATELGRAATRQSAALGCSGGGAVRFSALWPTRLGPGGRSHACSLYERFNPSLSDEWQGASAASSPTAASGPPAASGRPVEGDAAPTAGGFASAGPARPAALGLGQTAAESLEVDADVAALQDPDVVSKLLWSYGVLQCYSSSFYTLLFRHLQRLHPATMSWSALARLMGAQGKVLELQPSPGICRINPLEAESVTAWSRMLRTRVPVHKLPERYLAPCFVALHAEQMGRDDAGPADVTGPPGAAGSAPGPESAAQQLPGAPLSRVALQAEVAAALRDMGLQLRPSATVDGLFSLENTVLINGLTICLEVLSAGCCTLDPPHRPMGPAVARLRSLEFRGWTPLVVPFYEWAALAPADSSLAWARQTSPDGETERLRALQEAGAARQLYLRRKLEELLGEKLPPPPLLVPKRRMR